MIKFILILHLCSSLTGECFDNQTLSQHDDHYSCVINGYVQAYTSLQTLDITDINERKLAVRFECKELTIEKI